MLWHFFLFYEYALHFIRILHDYALHFIRRCHEKISYYFVPTSVAAILFLASQTASAVEVSPYFHAWGLKSLTQAKKAVGLNDVTLAFAITNGTCALHPDFLNKLPDARQYVALGGKLRISLGGQHGIYVETACTDDNKLFSILENLILDTGTSYLDFDVEGHQLLNIDSTIRRTRVLLRLQAKYPNLYVSFTLPGGILGVSSDSMNLLRTTAAAGVRIQMVNVMTMNFGLENHRTIAPPRTMAKISVMTFRAAVGQVSSVYPNKTPMQINAMMGITSMIGKNDDGSVFTLTDAKEISNFAKLNGVGFLSYWSFQRDRSQLTNASANASIYLDSYSGVLQTDYQFYKIFKTAVHKVVPICSNTAWVKGKQYLVGGIVAYNGKFYIAKFLNPGYEPTISTYYWEEYAC